MKHLEIRLPEGRLVQGHPMRQYEILEDDKKTPKLDKNGKKLYSTSVIYAIPKGTEKDWKATAWGKQIYDFTVDCGDWLNKEHELKEFSWKILDGDDPTIKQRRDKSTYYYKDIPGYSGHWLIKLSTRISQIQCRLMGSRDNLTSFDENKIKTGDYGIMYITVKANAKYFYVPDTSRIPGNFMSPIYFMKTKDGEEIRSAAQVKSMDEVFDDIDDYSTKPAYDITDSHAVVKYRIGSEEFTKDELLSKGFSESVIQTLDKVQ